MRHWWLFLCSSIWCSPFESFIWFYLKLIFASVLERVFVICVDDFSVQFFSLLATKVWVGLWNWNLSCQRTSGATSREYFPVDTKENPFKTFHLGLPSEQFAVDILLASSSNVSRVPPDGACPPFPTHVRVVHSSKHHSILDDRFACGMKREHKPKWDQ